MPAAVQKASPSSGASKSLYCTICLGSRWKPPLVKNKTNQLFSVHEKQSNVIQCSLARASRYKALLTNDQNLKANNTTNLLNLPFLNQACYQNLGKYTSFRLVGIIVICGKFQLLEPYHNSK